VAFGGCHCFSPSHGAWLIVFPRWLSSTCSQSDRKGFRNVSEQMFAPYRSHWYHLSIFAGFVPSHLARCRFGLGLLDRQKRNCLSVCGLFVYLLLHHNSLVVARVPSHSRRMFLFTALYHQKRHFLGGSIFGIFFYPLACRLASRAFFFPLLLRCHVVLRVFFFCNNYEFIYKYEKCTE